MKKINGEETLTYEPIPELVDLQDAYLLGFLKGRYQDELKEDYVRILINHRDGQTG